MPKPTKTAGVAAPAQVQTPAAGYDWSQSEVQGFENVNQEDLGIPFLAILQKGSPQVDRDHAHYATKKIEGAETGDIINTVSNMVVAGVGEQVEFIPCTYQRLFIEWTPREKGGGIVKVHANSLILNECQRNEKGQDVLRNGNLVVTSAEFHGLALLDGERIPCVVSMTSTQLKKAKQWLNMMMSLKMSKKDGTKYTPPMFSHSYMLSTVSEKNEQGSWRGWLIEMGGPLTDPVLIADAMSHAKMATQKPRQLSAPDTEADKVL
jgi:hypothetical protein